MRAREQAETQEPASQQPGGVRARIVFAPDSYKGSIRAAAAARALADGWLSMRPQDEVHCAPIADGGEGTLEAFAAAIPDAQRMSITVDGPLGHSTESYWLLLPGDDASPTTGVVELANTAGIELMPPGVPLRALSASSYGFGQAIAAALDHGVSRLVLAIGGSASSDGGAGVLTALGARVLDDAGREVSRGAQGLEDAARVELSGVRALPGDGVLVLSDVTSPLLGQFGSARVFGPQKGASPDEVQRIEHALARWARLLGGDTDARGAGAAGGVGFGLLACGAELVPGAGVVAELLGLKALIARADVVVTGEGSFDAQSEAGKGPSRVLELAREHGVLAAVVAGVISVPPAEGHTLVSLSELAGSAEAALRQPRRWLRVAGARLAAEFSSAV